MRKLFRLTLLLLLALLSCSRSGIGRTKISLKDVFVASKIQKIAFSVGEWKFGFGHVWIHEIYSMSVDDLSGRLIQPENSVEPAWSPDGSKLAFISFNSGKPSELYVANADGSNRTQLTTSKDGFGSVSWSLDGKRLAFSASTAEVDKLFVVNADGSDLHFIAEGDWPRWSPDGKRLAFHRGKPFIKHPKSAVWLINVDGSDARALTGDDKMSAQPNWLHDGSGIIFTSSRDGKAAIYSVDLGGMAVRVLMRSDKYGLYAPTMSPDSKVLVCDLISEGGPVSELGLPTMRMGALPSMRVGGLPYPTISEGERPSIVIIPLNNTNSRPVPVYVAKGGIHASVVWKR